MEALAAEARSFGEQERQGQSCPGPFPGCLRQLQNEALEEKFGALLHDVLIALVGAASGAADVLLGVEPVDDCC